MTKTRQQKTRFQSCFLAAGPGPPWQIPVDPCMPIMNYIHLHIGLNHNQIIKLHLNKSDTFR